MDLSEVSLLLALLSGKTFINPLESVLRKGGLLGSKWRAFGAAESESIG